MYGISWTEINNECESQLLHKYTLHTHKPLLTQLIQPTNLQRNTPHKLIIIHLQIHQLTQPSNPRTNRYTKPIIIQIQFA